MVIEVKLESGAELCPENPESIAVLSPFSNTHIFSCDRRAAGQGGGRDIRVRKGSARLSRHSHPEAAPRFGDQVGPSSAWWTTPQ